MKVKLIRNARICHKAGETVEVSPAEAQFLICTGSAAYLTDEAPRPRRDTKKKEPVKK
jgi:hypothetical protein